MGAYYQTSDRPFIDYGLESVPGLPGLPHRGPAVDPRRPYIVCLGAAQTFGRFCARPFPLLLAQSLGMQVQNLGVRGIGPAYYEAPELLDFIAGARLVVLQLLSGRSVGNSQFDNSETCSLLGIRQADGQKMRFEQFFAELCDSASPQEVRRIIAETQQRYLEETTRLLGRIQVPTILLWWSQRRPEDQLFENGPPFSLGSFPNSSTARWSNGCVPHCAAYLECSGSQGLPQDLGPADAEIDGTRLVAGRLQNHYYPSPAMHRAVARALEVPCRRLLGAGHRAANRGRVVFIHIPRTGGITFRAILQRVFAGRFCYCDDPDPEVIARQLRQHPCIELHNTTRSGRLLYVHETLLRKEHRQRLAGAHIYALFREPVDHYLSMYHWLQSQRPVAEPLFASLGRAFPETLEAFIQSEGGNHQLGALLGNIQTWTGRPVTRADLDEARRLIIELELVVGLTEDYPAFLHAFESSSGQSVRAAQPIRLQNRNARRDRRAPSDSERQAILAINPWDLELYAFVRARAAEQAARFGAPPAYAFEDA